LIFFLFGPLETGPVYAVVSVDVSLNDRRIGGLLDSAGLEGEYFSESTQWIDIDDFGALRKIPLDTYREEIEPFDPRDDGFAGKLRAFFVREGKRFFFIPLAEGGGGRKKLEKILFRALEDIPFDVEFLGEYRSFLPYLFLQAPCALAAIFLSGFPPGFVFQLFPLLGFVRGGPPALVLAALLACFWALFRDPLDELFAAPHRQDFYAGPGLRRFGEKLYPYRLNMMLAVVFLLLFGFVGVISGLPLLPVWTGLAASWGLCFLARAAEAERQKRAAHFRFKPVIMLPGRVKVAPLFPVAAVFGPAVFLSLLAPLFFPSLTSSPKEVQAVSDPRFLVSQADYEAHIAFERAFSRMPLGSNSPGEGYFRYYLGDDGLIAGSEDEGYDGGREEEIPSFPLENLMEFLLQYKNSAGELVPVQCEEWIPAVLFLVVLISAFFLRPKKAGNYLVWER
jgi:hypothetical protein